MQPITEIEVPEPVRPMRKLKCWGPLNFAACGCDDKVYALFADEDDARDHCQSCRARGYYVIDITTGEKV